MEIVWSLSRRYGAWVLLVCWLGSVLGGLAWFEYRAGWLGQICTSVPKESS